jgi:hypothetical protein
VWALVNSATPYPEVFPVLLAHLETGGYPDRVMESLGRAFAVRHARALLPAMLERCRYAHSRASEPVLRWRWLRSLARPQPDPKRAKPALVTRFPIRACFSAVNREEGDAVA